jgi:hypothetical protein
MQPSSRVSPRVVMLNRVMAAHKAAAQAESKLEGVVNDLQPGHGLAGAYDQLLALRSTKIFLMSLVDRLRQEQ